MKYAFLVAGFLIHLSSFGQKLEVFKGIDFDSSYTVIGIGQGYDDKDKDSLSGFWFLLDNPKDMEHLKQEWVFKNPVSKISLEQSDIDIYVIQNKRTTKESGLIYPNQGIIMYNSGWFKFDTARLAELHRDHPFKYHTEKKKFETYNQYAAYGNSILFNDSLLFFNEPSLRYEGQFTVVADHSNDPSNPIFMQLDLNKELKKLAPENSFQAGYVMNDNFEKNNPGKVRFTVQCSKTLYDRFKSKTFVKGDWEKAPIEMKLFWKD